MRAPKGLGPDAGNEILITRPARDGGPPLVQRIKVNGLIDAADPALNVTLEGGEEVRVPQIGRVFVVGNVKKPGAFRIEDGFGLTVLKALAMAEGLAPYATKEAFVYRRADGASTLPAGLTADPGATAGGNAAATADHSAAVTKMAAAPGIAAGGEEVRIDLKKIMDRKAPDVALRPNDIFYIPDDRKARISMNVLEKTVGFAAGTASGILILSRE